MAKQCKSHCFIFLQLIFLFLFSPIEITAIIQRPSAYLTPVELDIGESFLEVPIIRHIELHAINGLPTHFQWGEVSHQFENINFKN
jgi:hypothetical protein